MPEWVQTLAAIAITAIVAPILVRLFVPAWQRRKTEAEADSEVAETVAALTAAWDKLLTATQGRLEVAEAGIELRDEEIRNKDEQLETLYEQKMALMGQNLALTAKLAMARGVDVLNDAEGKE